MPTSILLPTRLAEDSLYSLLESEESGKSRLAYEVALRLENTGGIVWLACEDVSSADEILDLLKSLLGLPIDEQLELILHLVKSLSLLVVIDNAESIQDRRRRVGFIELANQLSQAGAKVLFTSREMWTDLPRAQEHALQEISVENAKEVCQVMCKIEAVALSDSEASELSRKAFCHPRLIEVAVTMCKTRSLA